MKRIEPPVADGDLKEERFVAEWRLIGWDIFGTGTLSGQDRLISAIESPPIEDDSLRNGHPVMCDKY